MNSSANKDKKLSKKDLHYCPFEQFNQWFTENQCTNPTFANVASLATADQQGTPSIRSVLLKKFSKQGFIFFTNYNSKKSQNININPQVSLLFFWSALERQVIIQGKAHKTSKEVSANYFFSRPRFSQLGAWCSPQSQVIQDRHTLEKKFKIIQEKFTDNKIPYPEFWGGYNIKPQYMEFWQGRQHRLHDRLCYQLQNGKWIIKRLAP